MADETLSLKEASRWEICDLCGVEKAEVFFWAVAGPVLVCATSRVDERALLALCVPCGLAVGRGADRANSTASRVPAQKGEENGE